MTLHTWLYQPHPGSVQTTFTPLAQFSSADSSPSNARIFSITWLVESTCGTALVLSTNDLSRRSDFVAARRSSARYASAAPRPRTAAIRMASARVTPRLGISSSVSSRPLLTSAIRWSPNDCATSARTVASVGRSSGAVNNHRTRSPPRAKSLAVSVTTFHLAEPSRILRRMKRSRRRLSPTWNEAPSM